MKTLDSAPEVFVPLINSSGISCNIGCKYCFHRYKQQQDFSQRMPISVIESLFTGMINIYGKKSLQVLWHGGEPMLAGMDFFQQAVDLQTSLTGSPESFENGIQTNATCLNAEWARFFKKYDFKVGLSIDGTPETHDKMRVFRNGKGTSSAVKKAIENLRAENCDFGVVCVVHQAHLGKEQAIFDFFQSMDIDNYRLSPCIEFGKDGNYTEYSLRPGDFGKFLINLFDIWVANNNPKIKIGYLEDIVHGILYGHCRSCLLNDTCRRFLVIDWNGEVRPCDDFCGQKNVLGNIQDGLDNIFKGTAYQQLFKGIDTERQKCKDCEWFSLCMQGCPYRKNKNGQYLLCEDNKIIFQYIASKMLEMA
jgi:uncharacterized protein